MAGMTKILKCTCSNEFQDKTYGKGMRVHNKTTQAKPSSSKWRCTVCLNEKN